MKVLVVEDDLHARDTLIDYLERHGYEADGAGDVENAIEKINREEWSVVIVDMKLPTKDNIDGDFTAGVKIVDYCKKKQPYTNCIIATKKFDDSIEEKKIEQCFEARAFRWVYKKDGGEQYYKKILKCVKAAKGYYIDDINGLMSLKDRYSISLGCPIRPDTFQCRYKDNLRFDDVYSNRNVFLAIPYERYENREDAIKHTLVSLGFNPIVAKESTDKGVSLCNICFGIRRSKYVIADVSKSNSLNILYEVGLSHALSKKVILLYCPDEKTEIIWEKFPWNIKSLIPVEYGKGDDDSGRKVSEALKSWLIINAKDEIITQDI